MRTVCFPGFQMAPFFLCPHVVERESESLASLPRRAKILLDQGSNLMILFNLVFSLQAHLQIQSYLGVNASIYEFWEATIQFIAEEKNLINCSFFRSLYHKVSNYRSYVIFFPNLTGTGKNSN